MKIKELLYKTPEMTEEKLLEIISNNLENSVYKINISFKNRIRELHKEVTLQQAFLDEYDLIQEKKSYLTKSERDIVLGFVGVCMIQMTKNDGESRSNNSLGAIPEIEEVRDNSESE